jgi:ADP-ribosylglycohydrolase
MKPTIQERLVGAVWGHLIGDAIGVPYEFSRPGTIDTVRWGATGSHNQPAGTWSDDGGLMLALLDSLLVAGFDTEDQGRRALAWYETAAYKPGPLFDVGVTTSRALNRLRSGTPAIEAGGGGERDNGNGSLMRILPVALVDRTLSIDQLVERASSASSLTHRHPRARLTCAVYCVLARRLLEGADGDSSLLDSVVDDVRRAGAPELRDELEHLTGFETRTGDGYVLDCFWSAWDAFASTTSYPEAVEKAIGFGNDTDTTACVAGGLAGLRWGIGSIPVEWRQAMRGQELVRPLIDRLIDRWMGTASA